MKKIYLKQVLVTSLIILSNVLAFAQQVPNPGFEDWSGAKFDGKIQPANWNVSNIEQVGIKFNLTHQEAGHTGSYSLMVQDTKVGALGITEVSPGYFSLGKPWSHLEGIDTKTATAGTSGGINFKYRPDSMSVWIKRTGENVEAEDFYLLYYAWSGTAKGSKYKAKNGGCTSKSQTNEESDIRQALDANECGTDQLANQIAEGMWRERKEYGQWTNIRVPIYYFNNDVPTMMNIIFSASNYPNYRANSGLYEGNSLYVDDVELIYSSKIQQLWVDGKEWKGFDPNSAEEQIYSLGTGKTTIPSIEAIRGAGELSNARGKTISFSGRKLTSNEISIKQGIIDGAPVEITVKSEDGKSTSTYKIKFVSAASTNTKLASILANGKEIKGFDPKVNDYNEELPYGSTIAPEVSVVKQEDEQSVEITQPSSVNGKSTIKVTAANKSYTSTYTVNFSVAKLSDNTLKDIKVNGVSIPGFTPSLARYTVSLPTTTTVMPTVEAVSAYPAGEQTIIHTAPATIDGGEYLLSVTTPGNAKTKIYRIKFKLEASSYSQLKSLQMGDNLIPNFDPNQFTYYVNLPVGTTELPKITYEKGEPTQTVSITESGLDGVSKVIVTAGDGKTQSEYKIVVSTAKSEISSLDMIYIGGEKLADFAPNKTSYTYTLPIGTTALPAITYDQADEYQAVTITYGGTNGMTRIAVKAQNGNTTVYEITFSVAKATNANLKMIYLDGKPLEGFDENTFEYNCPLPQGTTTLPVITYDKADEYQTITVRDNGINGDYKITVTPGSGAAKTYTLRFSVATSDNANLEMIYVDGQELAGFDSNILNYVDTLPMGVLTMPKVTWILGDSTQQVLPILRNNVQTLKVTAESGKTQTYTITFIIQRSNSAFLKMIYLDGDSLLGFDKNQFDYTVSLKQDKCPTISVDKDFGQQVTITAPFFTGLAKIEVKPEAGATNTYTINFVDSTGNSAWLNSISVDNTPIADFNSHELVYSVIARRDAEITFEKANASQQVTEFRQGNIVTLLVVNGVYKAQYQITLREQANSDCTLRDIRVNGTTLDGFSPNKREYTLLLPSDSIPNISFEKQYAEQVVYAGMLNANTYSLLVAAQSGDTARYTLHLEKQLSDDANLVYLGLQGMEGAFTFLPDQYEYIVSLPEGYDLPHLLIESQPTQDVAMHSESETEQQVIVTAESGKTNIYRIIYDRKKSANAWLADILINGTSLDGFHAETYEYTHTLAWRTKIVPCVQPIGSHKDQVITTYHSAIDGTTTITVLAPDGITTKTYAIHFPVIKSSNTALESIELDHETLKIDYKATTTEYYFALPYKETEVPLVLYQAAEPEQTIQYISRPLGQTSEIIVTAENGEKATYKLHFAPTYATQPNQLASLTIAETGSSLAPTQTEHTISLPYGTRTMTVNYTKQFPEQTVWVQPGGIHAPTIITVKSNRPNEEDVVYTLTPQVGTQDPAVLTEIKVNGTTIEAFDANQFSYIVNVTNAPVIAYTAAPGAQVNILMQTTKHWQAQVTYNGRTNIYNVWYYYKNDQVPNTEFTEWTTCETYTSAPKPKGWNTIADALGTHSGFFSFNPDKMVQKSGNDAVFLETPYSTPGGGNIPGFITLGTVTGKWGVSGSSSFPISGGISFHNSPDQVAIRYYNKKVKNHSLIQYSLTGTHGVKTLEWKDADTQSDYKVATFDLSEANKIAGDPTLLNITICSFHITNSQTNTALNTLAEMYVDYLRFSYNSALKGLKVNDSIATKDGNTFSFTLPDPENTLIPTLTFMGEVDDQAQKVVWSDEVKGEGFGIRTATITNYAENSTSTEYTLELKRPLDTKNKLGELRINGTAYTAFVANKTEYTIHLASTTKHLPDVQPIAGSSLQTIATSYADSTMTIVVTPEFGEATTYTVRFVTDLSDDVELTNINIEGHSIDFKPTQREYTITTNQLPSITFVKKMDGQTVNLNNGVLHVTAENGATGTYTILLDKPVTTTTGQLADLEVNGISLQGFSSDTYEYTLDQPTTVAFKRSYDSDSVVFVQKPEYMEWQVYGTEQHNYRLTYPTELSSNTALKAFYIDGALYEEFEPQVYNYTYRTDNPVQIHAVANEKADSLHVTYTVQGDSSIYTYTVVAENGAVGNPYTLTVVPNLSNTPYLQSISLDGNPLAGFQADSLQYTIVLPVGAYKVVEPTIPTIAYQLGAPRQHVTIEQGSLNQSTYIFVTSEDGTVRQTYELYFQAAPSQCADLSGIAVNGVPVDHFESGRHYYSVMTSDDDITLTWASIDNFQTVTFVQDAANIYRLHVVAQDGISTSDYTVEIFREQLASDVTLANILLDNKPLDQFETAFNHNLSFSPMQQRYTINLPSGTQYLPEINALLNSEGQTIDAINTQQTSPKDWLVEIHVTAQDKQSHNTYILHFTAPKSSNAKLEKIYYGNDLLANFSPDQLHYFVDLPIGETTIPTVEALPQQDGAQVEGAITGPLQYTIYVTAEDGTQLQYLLVFQPTYSDADSLLAITGDGILIPGFQPDSLNYTYTLPIGTDHIPAIDWDVADKWQTVIPTQLLRTPTKQITQLEVYAASGKKRIYTISYEILQSSVDTLQMIWVGADSIATFEAQTLDYYVHLAPGDSIAPYIGWRAGEDYQVITSQTTPYQINNIQQGWKNTIDVQAQDGHHNIYTVYTLFSKVPSTNTNLADIYLNGQSISGFNPEQHNYFIDVPYGETRPTVLVEVAETVQNIQITNNDTLTTIIVTAEDQAYTDTYKLYFNYLQSSYAYLASIKQDSALISDFRADSLEYNIVLPYGTTELPKFTYELGIDGQSISVDTILSTTTEGQPLTYYCVVVTAPDEETVVQYDIYVTIALNDDCCLQSLLINGEEIDGFHADTINYQIIYPIGNDSTALIGKDAITALANDTNATVLIIEEDYNFTIIVTAHDGETRRIYTIEQIITLSDNARLSAIYLDSVLLRDFDPEVMEYVYYITTAQPTIEAIAEDSMATVEYSMYTLGEPFYIYVTAHDGTELVYTIQFIPTTIEASKTPTAHDVMIKHIGGLDFAVATLRKNVSIGVYTHTGHLVFFSKLNEVSQNDAVVVTNPDGSDKLLDVHSTTTQFTLPHKNHIFFYVFFDSDNRRIDSGKLVVR